MNIDKCKESLIEELKNKEYRDAFVFEHIDTGIPFQIRALRNQRKWTQRDLGDRTGKKQEGISRLEDPNYANFTLSTLKELASAFDVGLMVRFVPISDLVKWDLELTSESLKAVSFEQDSYFKGKTNEISTDLATPIASNAITMRTETLPAETPTIPPSPEPIEVTNKEGFAFDAIGVAA